jgi:hypothetical protein
LAVLHRPAQIRFIKPKGPGDLLPGPFLFALTTTYERAAIMMTIDPVVI